MSSLFYITGGDTHTNTKRYYQIKKNNTKKTGDPNGIVKRISCQEYDDRTKNKELGKIKPQVGSEVIIIIKPYHNYECKRGIISRVLTNKQIHTRGHKVMLTSGLVGRTLKIIKL
jgi:uncharacterized repeat protein (TIGR03833 family)